MPWSMQITFMRTFWQIAVAPGPFHGAPSSPIKHPFSLDAFDGYDRYSAINQRLPSPSRWCRSFLEKDFKSPPRITRGRRRADPCYCTMYTVEWKSSVLPTDRKGIKGREGAASQWTVLMHFLPLYVRIYRTIRTVGGSCAVDLPEKPSLPVLCRAHAGSCVRTNRCRTKRNTEPPLKDTRAAKTCKLPWTIGIGNRAGSTSFISRKADFYSKW